MEFLFSRIYFSVWVSPYGLSLERSPAEKAEGSEARTASAAAPEMNRCFIIR